MTKILVIAEHLDGKLNSAVAKTVSAAAAIGGDIDVLVLAADPAAIAAEIMAFSRSRWLFFAFLGMPYPQGSP